MYNSHIVSVLVSIWTGMLKLYEDSLVNRVLSKIKSFIIYITRESKLISLFRDKKMAVEESFINRSYSWILGKYNKIIVKINSRITKIQKNSLVDETIDKLAGDYNKIFQTILVFLIFFIIGVLGQSLFHGMASKKLVLVSLSILGLLALILNAGNKIVDIFKNSWLINIFLNLISSKEEGSGQWW